MNTSVKIVGHTCDFAKPTKEKQKELVKSAIRKAIAKAFFSEYWIISDEQIIGIEKWIGSSLPEVSENLNKVNDGLQDTITDFVLKEKKFPAVKIVFNLKITRKEEEIGWDIIIDYNGVFHTRKQSDRVDRLFPTEVN